MAHPSLEDPNFSQAVIFLLEHTKEGALGFNLTRPTQQNLEDFELPPEIAWGHLLAFDAGPVDQDTLRFLTLFPDAQGIIQIEEFSDTSSYANSITHAFFGYAGWNPLQLDNEIAQNVWLLHPASFHLLVDVPREHLWQTIISNLAPSQQLEAKSPKNISLN